MNVVLPEKAHLNGMYDVGNCDLGYLNQETGVWHGCRESFHRRITENKIKEIMFKTPSPGRAIAFLEHAQDILKLKDVDRLTVHKTQHRNIVLVKMSAWWMVPIRKSLLTILLRASRSYGIRKKDFWGTLKNNQYLGNQFAVQRFMDGYTKYTGSFRNGWRSALASKPKDDVNKVLK